MVPAARLDDRDLVAAARGGDRDALVATYDRYGDRIHDFCWSVLRDRAAAADVARDTFLLAWQRLGQLRDPDRLRPWLYAIARDESLRCVRARRRVTPSAEPPDIPDEAGEGASRRDLVRLVWETAGGLEQRDRTLLDLSVRQGLDGHELADILGIRRDHAHVQVSSLRQRAERSLAEWEPAAAEICASD